MGTVDDVTARSPSILMIEGCEHVLYQGLLGHTRIADARLLWLNTARVWAIALYGLLTAINAVLPEYRMCLAFVGLAAICGAAALSIYIENRGLLTVPDALAESERTQGSCTLAITSKSQRVFSGRLPLVHFATVRPQMADFLLSAFAEGQSRRFRHRQRVPVALTTPSARLQAWAETVGLIVALLGVVSIFIAIALR